MLREPFYLLKLSTLLTLLGVSMSAWSVEITPDLQLHGYATLGLAKLDGSQGASYPTNPGGTGTSLIKPDTTELYDSVAGIQLNYRLDDHISMALQAYLAAQDLSQKPNLPQYAVKLHSAYIDYTFNDQWTVRAGRIPFSTYVYSDNKRVGEVYPWARLPPEVYSKLGGLFSENGVAVIYRHTFDDWILRVQPSFGQENLSSYQVNRSRQIDVSLSNDSLTLHMGTGQAAVDLDRPLVNTLRNGINGVMAQLGYSPTDIQNYNKTFDANLPTRNLRGTFSDIGFIYDNGHWFAVGEMSTLRFSGFVNDFNAGYASVGYHFGKWLPYVVYAKYKDINLDEINQIPAPGNAIYTTSANVQQQSFSVGARYKIRDNISLKLQADRVTGFEGNYFSGLFIPPHGTTGPSTLKSVYIYSISLNTAF